MEQRVMATCREDVKKHLESGETVFYHEWAWTGLYMNCGDFCCDGEYETTEDAVDGIEGYCDGRWELVELV